MKTKQTFILLTVFLSLTAFGEGIHWYAGVGGGWGVATLKNNTEISVVNGWPEYESINFLHKEKKLDSFRFSSTITGGISVTSKISIGAEVSILQEAGDKESAYDTTSEHDPFCGGDQEDKLLVRYTTYSIICGFDPLEINLRLNLSLGWGTYFQKEIVEFSEQPAVTMSRIYYDGPAISAGIGYSYPIYRGLNVDLGMSWSIHFYTGEDFGERAEIGIFHAGLSWQTQK